MQSEREADKKERSFEGTRFATMGDCGNIGPELEATQTRAVQSAPLRKVERTEAAQSDLRTFMVKRRAVFATENCEMKS